MRGLSVFSGAGGLDRGAEISGIKIVGQIEIDPACRRVLKAHWPNMERWCDVRNVTGSDVRRRCGAIDIIFGGPPCQPVSVAGRRLASSDERNMWPEYIRLLREIRPRYAVAENPTGILSAEKGEFFGRIVAEIASLGYRVGWGVWGACDVEDDIEEKVDETEYLHDPDDDEWQVEDSGACAPHLRERLFLLLAHSKSCVERRLPFGTEKEKSGSGVCRENVAYSQDQRCKWSKKTATIFPWPQRCRNVGHTGGAGRTKFHASGITEESGYAAGEPAGRTGKRMPESGMGGMLGRAADRMDSPRWPAGRGAEQYPWEPPRTIPRNTCPGRSTRIKMLGNVVVPQQAAILFHTIMEIDRLLREIV